MMISAIGVFRHSVTEGVKGESGSSPTGSRRRVPAGGLIIQ